MMRLHPVAPRLAALLVTLVAALALTARPVAAQSILRDAETEQLFADMAAPLVTAAGLVPANVDIVLVNDPSVNAFVAGGQAVYINSGLINEASSANQVQGVIAHELGHVTGGHAVFNPGAQSATGISLLSSRNSMEAWRKRSPMDPCAHWRSNWRAPRRTAPSS